MEFHFAPWVPSQEPPRNAFRRGQGMGSGRWAPGVGERPALEGDAALNARRAGDMGARCCPLFSKLLPIAAA